MNHIWSRYVQGTKTLYYSRRLRFNDMFAEQYKALFQLDENKDLKILEVGCGPGAFAGALHRWYPKAEITAIDRDSEFIRFAGEHESGVTFIEADAVSLPFEDNSFDVVISNTVCEHIEPSAFYGEQLRVIKPKGCCLVLSSRKGIVVTPNGLAPNEQEKKFWEKAERYDDTMAKYSICKYPMSEMELPATMEKYGFKNIRTGFVTADLIPDNPKYPDEMAHDMIEAGRYTDMDAVDSVIHTMPEHFTDNECKEMKRLINAKYDARIAQYNRGEKQWDTNVSIIMVIRGIK